MTDGTGGGWGRGGDRRKPTVGWINGGDTRDV